MHMGVIEMKRIVFAFIAALALDAMATDSYLYWIVSDTGDYDNTWEYARISGNDGNSYLNLYNGDTGAALTLGGGTRATKTEAMDVGLYANIGSQLGSTYLVELLWGETTVATTSLDGGSLASYLTSSLLSPAGSPKAVGGFTATGVVPEPTSGMLSLFGLALLALRRRRQFAGERPLILLSLAIFATSAMAALEIDLSSCNPGSGVDAWKTYINKDIVVDSYVKLPVYEPGQAPTTEYPNKCAIYLYDNGVETNLCIVAAGFRDTSAHHTATSYCLNVSAEAMSAEKHHITVYALRNVSTGSRTGPVPLMGFVVFVDGEPVACKDDDYRQKFIDTPYMASFTDSAKALIAKKMLFLSLARESYSYDSGTLTRLIFEGGGDEEQYVNEEDVTFGCTPEILETMTFADLSSLTNWDVVVIGSTVSASQTNSLTTASLVAPEEAELNDAQQETYRALFAQLLFKEVGEDSYMVMAVPKEEALASISNNVNSAVLMINLDAVDNGFVELDTVVPGIFYRVKRGTSVAAADKNGEWSVAKGTGKVTVEIPEGSPDDTAGFFRVEANPIDE